MEDTQRDAAFSLKNTSEPADMAKTNDATALLELSDRDGTGRDEGIVRESFNGNGETRRRLPPRRPLEKYGVSIAILMHGVSNRTTTCFALGYGLSLI